MTTERSAREGSARIGVIGTGYVGLTTAVCLARLGHNVCAGDVDADKVALLSTGRPTIIEEDLEDILREQLASGRLSFVVGATEAARSAEFVFLCVATPQLPDGSADTSMLESAVTEIAGVLEHDAIVVNKSTVPVGSTLVVERMLRRNDIAVVSNPEFLREGSAVRDGLNPERIVVGASDHRAAARVGALFAGTKAPLIVTDAASAEMIKYASNAFLATKLAFVNSIANLCEAVGTDVRDVLLGMAYDHRIGFDYLRPGPGWGGSCLPKDTAALLYSAEQAGYDFDLLRSVIEANVRQRESVVSKIVAAAGGSLAGCRIAIWGLTFKAGTDDLRSSPAVAIAQRLLGAGASLSAYDPTVREPIAELPGVSLTSDAYEACVGARVLVVLTEWEELRWVDFDKVRELLDRPCVVDARNVLDPAAMRRLGFTYTAMGRP
jgi:UDPglucose 6-dehydrogenase